MVTTAPKPPGGVGDDPPELRNVILAVVRFLVDLEGVDFLTEDHQLRRRALLRAVKRFRKAQGL